VQLTPNGDYLLFTIQSFHKQGAPYGAFGGENGTHIITSNFST